VVLVETGVLGGDHRVLQVGRDLSERNELVAFAIGRAVNQRLYVALHMHGGGGRIDPARGDES